MKFMTLVRSPEPAPIEGPPQALFDAIMRLGAEAEAAGVLVEQGGLLPTGKGALMMVDAKGNISTIDGPFSETKEVIGGYAIYDVANRQDILYWSRRFAQLHVDHWPGFAFTIEIRQMFYQSQGEGK